ncbi:MAG: hypothetical protein K2G86_10640 [Prevotella sp.]|nr:hypothetical protein [Prevotella sp.]
MKKITYIIASVIVLMSFSCSRFEYRKSLIVADSLTETDPKRSIAMLDSMAPMMADAPKHEQMYHRLLQIKAADKSYIKHSSDSTILSLVEYYETEGDKTLLPEAYYYAGSIYRDIYDAPRALEYYQKAIDGISGGNMRVKGHIYFQSGSLLLNQALYNQAINMYLKAFDNYKIQGDNINCIHTLHHLAYTYNKINKKDSCLHYYQRASKLSKDINNEQMGMMVLAQMASFHIEQGDYSEAKKCLKPSLDTLDSINISPYYTMALKICMNTQQYDSAHFYATELLKIGTIYAKQTASRCLTELALRENSYDNVAKYLKLFNEYTDSVKTITATESVNRMNSLYNYNLREKENLILKAENANKKVALTITICTVFTLSIILITYIYRNRQKQKLQIERFSRLRKELYEQSTEFIRKNKEKIEFLEQELKRTSDENHLLIERLEEQRADLILANETAIRKQTRNESAKARIVATDIFKTIQNYIKKEKAVNAKEWKELDEIINKEIPDFKTNLYSYYNISPHEYHICILIRLEFSPTDMAMLLGCTTSAVSKARKRLQEKFFSDKGTPKDFDQFIKTL